MNTSNTQSSTVTEHSIVEQIMSALHRVNPYEGFDCGGRVPTPTALNREVFLPMIESLKPAISVEVGSWKGASSVFFAKALRAAREDSCLLCVDTWLGSVEHFYNPPSDEWDLHPMMEHGFPRLYEHWMTSILDAGVQDTVVPLANTSTAAAKWFDRVGLKAGFVFIDAGHDEDDVTSDINAWWPNLLDGGVLAGDDWSSMWPGVERAVMSFCNANGLKPRLAGPNWIVQKPRQETPKMTMTRWVKDTQP